MANNTKGVCEVRVTVSSLSEKLSIAPQSVRGISAGDHRAIEPYRQASHTAINQNQGGLLFRRQNAPRRSSMSSATRRRGTHQSLDLASALRPVTEYLLTPAVTRVIANRTPATSARGQDTVSDHGRARPIPDGAKRRDRTGAERCPRIHLHGCGRDGPRTTRLRDGDQLRQSQ